MQIKSTNARVLYINTVGDIMILYIAEKPSLGKAIAAVLPKPQQINNGFIRLANGDIVSWCIGHLLEQAAPEQYNPEFKRWQAKHLPIIPLEWQLTVKLSTAKQFKILKNLIKQADKIIHAGDPDREGQLLVDQMLAYCGVKGEKLNAIQRLLINDLNPAAVKKSLLQLKSNKDFVPLSTSALARSRADWLYGLNMTRAYTLQGQKSGYNGVLSVGRVQTPLLGLVVRRDEEIANFISKPFYQVSACVSTEANEQFVVHWLPSQACLPYQDSEGRILVKALAEQVKNKIINKTATVTKLEQKDKKQLAPLPYNLSTLQIDAAKRYGISAQQVLDACQQLYERHKLITYPRSDCRYLPLAQFTDAAMLCQSIAANSQELAVAATKANIKLRSKAWNDSKVTAHHAIIPTAKRLALTKLSLTEQRLYLLIATQYLAQFYPAYCYAETYVEVTILTGIFRATAKVEQTIGWKQLFRQASAIDVSLLEQDEHQVKLLPPLTLGQALHCIDATVIEKHTQAPQHFTDASLLAAMTGISRYVQDPAIRKILRDTDGLGTDATRASIIELLFKRQFIQRQGKHIHATKTGKTLIQALPIKATLPDMTALWEASLNNISQQKSSYQSFMQPLCTELQQLITDASNLQAMNLAKAIKPHWPTKKASGSKTKSFKRKSVNPKVATKRN